MRKEELMLTERFNEALVMAAELHGTQLRKGTKIPYVSHVLSVASLVLENGGDEETAIAALLHDAAEDQGGRETLERIRACFGERVAEIVESCSDTLEEVKPPWRERKEHYIAHLREASPNAALVSAADKLHNARAILADYRVIGPELWSRFSAAKKDELLWYYDAVTEALRGRAPDGLVEELARTVAELRRLVAVREGQASREEA